MLPSSSNKTLQYKLTLNLEGVSKWRDIFIDLYKKTSYRIKSNGKLSEPINESAGVNQGGITSPFLFREYISDIKSYLDEYTGVCVTNEIIIHKLWADDLYLVADNPKNSQKQLDGLGKFCIKNHMIANVKKNKVHGLWAAN